MKLLQHLFVLMTSCFVVGCVSNPPPSPSVSVDDQRFAAIVRYYRETCPTTTFDTHPYSASGPRGERLNINVPVAVDTEYMHPFSLQFLERQSKSADGLNRMIAEHLTYLRGKRLFKRDGITRVSYGGPYLDCTTYVVQIDKGLR